MFIEGLFAVPEIFLIVWICLIVNKYTDKPIRKLAITGVTMAMIILLSVGTMFVFAFLHTTFHLLVCIGIQLLVTIFFSVPFIRKAYTLIE